MGHQLPYDCVCVKCLRWESNGTTRVCTPNLNFVSAFLVLQRRDFSLLSLGVGGCVRLQRERNRAKHSDKKRNRELELIIGRWRSLFVIWVEFVEILLFWSFTMSTATKRMHFRDTGETWKTICQFHFGMNYVAMGTRHTCVQAGRHAGTQSMKFNEKLNTPSSAKRV